jgi:hypothetical protein
MIRRAALLLLCMVTAVVSAQTERVTIRRAMAANQTLHVRITSEWDFDQPGSGSFETRNIHTETRASYTVTAGAHGEGERYDARIVFEEATIAITANGQPSTSQEQLFRILVGKPIVASYDAQGRFQDVTDVPPELSAAGPGVRGVNALFTNGAFTADALLQRMPPLFDVTVGNSMEVPSEVALPIPGMDPAVPGGRRLKLIASERDGADRIARFEQTFEGVLSGAMIGQDVSLSASGSGTLDWNIDRGFVNAYEIRFVLDATSVAGVLHHTVHTRMSAAN